MYHNITQIKVSEFLPGDIILCSFYFDTSFSYSDPIKQYDHSKYYSFENFDPNRVWQGICSMITYYGAYNTIIDVEKHIDRTCHARKQNNVGIYINNNRSDKNLLYKYNAHRPPFEELILLTIVSCPVKFEEPKKFVEKITKNISKQIYEKNNRNIVKLYTLERGHILINESRHRIFNVIRSSK